MMHWPPRMMSDFLQRSALNYPDRTALTIVNEKISYRELWDYSRRLAAALTDLGLRRGDRVVIFLENSIVSAVSIFGTLLAGGVFVVVNPQTKIDKLRYILVDCTAKVLISNAKLKKVFLPAGKDLEHLNGILAVGTDDVTTSPYAGTQARISDFFSTLEGTDPWSGSPPSIPVDLAALIYTSGTTGFPKGVMMTHQAMVFTTGSLMEYLRLDDNHRILCALPLAFDYGLYQLLMAVALGATLVLEPTFVFPRPVFERMEQQGVTVFPGVPSIFATLITLHERNPLEFNHITRVTNTAAALPPDFLPTLKEIFPRALFFKMYGLTECKRVSYLEPELLETNPTSVGTAIPGTEVSLLSDTGESVPRGQDGILHVRGPHVMKGYWNDPERSARALRPGPFPGEFILCTHDVFQMDAKGFLYFQGRSDDIIKSRGEKVSPREVENALHAVPGVLEAAVIGVPDQLLGEAISALVVRKQEGRPSREDLLRFCRENLEGFMVPRNITFLTELPHTASGKIDRKTLKTLAAEG